MSKEIDALLAIMTTLRHPVSGCPWDIAQDFKSIAKHTIEEAYEVVDAIEQDDMAALKGELGDLLFQVIFYAQMAKEQGLYDFAQIVQTLNDKMIKRHPHIFAEQKGINSAADQIANWEAQKEAERTNSLQKSVLDGVTSALPALSRAVKLQARAARVGFDWATVPPILAKLQEEIAELQTEIDNNAPTAKLQDELGDILFVVANLARRLDIDPETALRSTNDKFTQRFKFIETSLSQAGRDINNASLQEMEDLWQRAKTHAAK